MQSVKVAIDTFDKVKAMGIFSLDLSKPICLNVNTEDNIDAVYDVLSAYMV